MNNESVQRSKFSKHLQLEVLGQIESVATYMAYLTTFLDGDGYALAIRNSAQDAKWAVKHIRGKVDEVSVNALR